MSDLNIDRAAVESFLNFASKLQGAQEIARLLLQLSDVNGEISTAKANLAQAKADAERHAAETAERHNQELTAQALAAARIVDEANAEAKRVIDGVRADIDKMAKKHADDVSQREAELIRLADRKSVLEGELDELGEQKAQVEVALGNLRNELATVEGQLASARESIANLLKV